MKKFWEIIVLVTALFLQGHFISAQEITNFAAWKIPQNASFIPDWSRRMLVRDFRDITGDVRKKRLEEYLSELGNIVSDANVVPPTRYNAILAIGQLVSEEASPGNLPGAYPAALPYLIDVCQKTDSPAYLKYGALLGIVRHTNCGIDPAQREGVTDLLLKIVKDELGSDVIIYDSDFASPFEPAIWDWFRRTALDGLSALKSTGTNGNVVDELLLVMNQKSQEIELFCQSKDVIIQEKIKQVRQIIELASKIAKTLGDLHYSSAAVEIEMIPGAFVRLGKAVCDVEHKIAAESLKKGNTSPDLTVLKEQIVIDLKTCSQSIAWGIRCGFLTSKPAEQSLCVSLQNNKHAIKQLDSLWTVLTELSVFLDEGNKKNPQTPSGDNADSNVPKRSFKFDLPELRDALAKFSASLAKI